MCGGDLMDTGDAPVGRATDLVGYFWAATDDRTAKLKRIKAGKVLGGWECKACNNFHSQFENMDVVCDDCGADRVPLIASPEVQIRSPPDEQPRRSPDQRQPPHLPTEQDGAASLAQKRAAAAGAYGVKKRILVQMTIIEYHRDPCSRRI